MSLEQMMRKLGFNISKEKAYEVFAILQDIGVLKNDNGNVYLCEVYSNHVEREIDDLTEVREIIKTVLQKYDIEQDCSKLLYAFMKTQDKAGNTDISENVMEILNSLITLNTEIGQALITRDGQARRVALDVLPFKLACNKRYEFIEEVKAKTIGYEMLMNYNYVLSGYSNFNFIIDEIRDNVDRLLNGEQLENYIYPKATLIYACSLLGEKNIEELFNMNIFNLERYTNKLIEIANDKCNINEIFDCKSIKNNTSRDNDDLATVEEHEKIPGMKLMVVVDGVSEGGMGYLASHLFCTSISDWFQKLNDFTNMEEKLVNVIKKADKNIYNHYFGGAQAVASVILITPKDTYISTVGDTRVYLERSGILNRVNRIEKRYDKALKLGVTDNEAEYRARRMPEGYIGLGSDNWCFCNPEVLKIPSNSYDSIMAVTDGVYNELTDEMLSKIFNNCYSDDIADTVVNLASFNMVNESYQHLNLQSKPSSYRDDSTIAIYKKNPILRKRKTYTYKDAH